MRPAHAALLEVRQERNHLQRLAQALRDKRGGLQTEFPLGAMTHHFVSENAADVGVVQRNEPVEALLNQKFSSALQCAMHDPRAHQLVRPQRAVDDQRRLLAQRLRERNLDLR